MLSGFSFFRAPRQALALIVDLNESGRSSRAMELSLTDTYELGKRPHPCLNYLDCRVENGSGRRHESRRFGDRIVGEN